MFEWHKKEKPFFTGIARGVGGAAFGGNRVTGIVPVAFSATGGTIDTTSVTNYIIHSFTYTGSPQTFISNSPGYVDLLLVGAGGGGGYNWGAGGGGGGVVVARDVPITGGVSNTITVGNHPGTRHTNPAAAASSGNPSTFVHPSGTFTALGGGGGGSYETAGNPGGSGGGGTINYAGGTATQPTQPQPSDCGYVSNFGNNGAGSPSPSGPSDSGYGGGGAGGSGMFGQNGRTTASQGGNGGNGIDISGLFGTTYGENGYVGGGGGGRGTSSNPATTPSGGGIGGYGGGGDNLGSFSAPQADGLNGSGGGGAGNDTGSNVSGIGGNGIVLVRYSRQSVTYTSATGGDVTFTKGNYKYHMYTTAGNGSFVVNTLGTDKNIDILLVGGGGGGSHPYGGGGGGGGVIYRENHSLPGTGTYSLRVGGGGAAGGPGGGAGNANGDPSAFGTQLTSSPYPADSLIALGGGRGSSYDAPAENPGGSGGGSPGQAPTPGATAGYGLQGGHGPAPTFLPANSLRSGKGHPGGPNSNPGIDNYGGGGGGAGGFDVQRSGPGNSLGGSGWYAPTGFLPQPFAPWMPGYTNFFGYPIPGNPDNLRVFGTGGSGGPSGSPRAGGGGANVLLPSSPDIRPQPSDPGGGYSGRGGGGSGSNSDCADCNGPGGSGSVIIRYRYQ